jgi:hypothetical protein
MMSVYDRTTDKGVKMVCFIGRLFVCSLMILPAVQPALACECVPSGDDCGCETQCTTCEPVVVESEACDECAPQTTIVGDCGCGSVESCKGSPEEATESESLPSVTPAEPQPAETQKPETFAPTTEVKPIDTPAPELEPSDEQLPPAPIAVPSDTVPAESNQEQILPGPASAETAPAETAPAEEATPDRTNTEGLFDEPAPTTEPAPATSTPATPPATEDTTTEEPTRESSETEGLFEESTPPAEESTEDSNDTTPEGQPESETPETEDSEQPADPLDELFGPSAPAEDPAPESPPESTEDTEEEESTDPFGETSAVLNAPGGLASRKYRTWSDPAANVNFEARLIRFSTTGVFLSQPSGEIIAVSFSQLSDGDLHFVRDQLHSQRVVLARARASEDIHPIVAQASSL